MHFVRATKHWYRFVRWDGIKSREQALNMVKERARQLPEGEWLMVMGGFIFEQFQDNSDIFSIEELDEVLPNRPLYIQEGYGRAFVNTAALSAVGILNEAMERPGLIRNDQGILTGELRGRQGYGLVDSQIPDPTEVIWDDSVKQTINSLLSLSLIHI